MDMKKELFIEEQEDLVRKKIKAIDELIATITDERQASAVLLQKGALCERIHDFESAKKSYTESIHLYSDDPEMAYWQYNNLGFCLNYLKQFDKAEEWCRKAIEINDEQYNAWKNLGVALENQGSISEAIDCYKKSAELSPVDKRAALHLERLMKRLREDLERKMNS